MAPATSAKLHLLEKQSCSCYGKAVFITGRVFTSITHFPPTDVILHGVTAPLWRSSHNTGTNVMMWRV